MGISYSKDSNISVVKNKQLLNSKIERLCVISAIKFLITIFVILLDYVAHYPIRVNFATFLVN